MIHTCITTGNYNCPECEVELSIMQLQMEAKEAYYNGSDLHCICFLCGEYKLISDTEIMHEKHVCNDCKTGCKEENVDPAELVLKFK